MALSIGTLSVDPLGVVTGVGSARDLYDLMLVTIGGDIPSGPDGADAKQTFINIATMFATWRYNDLTTNAQLVVLAADADLQRSASEGNLTTASFADKTFGAIV